MSEWWRDFFDADYLRISHALFPDSVNEAQAGAIWQLLELTPGARLLAERDHRPASGRQNVRCT